jgi:small subunit ribosomal protein S7e
MEVQKKPARLASKPKPNKNPQPSQMESQVTTALQEVISGLDEAEKKACKFVGIKKVVELPNEKEKPIILAFLTNRSHKVLITSLYKKLVNELEKKLKTFVLLLAARNIQSRWVKKNRTQKRPFSRTLSSVQEALLTELLLPGIVISDRVRVRLDGSQVRKVTLDKTEEHFLEERTEVIKKAYKKLTTRDLEIAFDKEPVFYTLKSASSEHQK